MSAKKVAKGTVIGTMRAMKDARMMALVIPYQCTVCKKIRRTTTQDIKIDAARGMSCRYCNPGRGRREYRRGESVERVKVNHAKVKSEPVKTATFEFRWVGLDYREADRMWLATTTMYQEWLRMPPVPKPKPPKKPVIAKRQLTEDEEVLLRQDQRERRMRERMAKVPRKKTRGGEDWDNLDNVSKLIENAMSAMD